MKILSLMVTTLLVGIAHAETVPADVKIYTQADTKSTGVTFQIGYSAGVHDGTVTEIDSRVTLDNKNQILSGVFIININQMSTGNKNRDCHMREALGINYVNSKFPDEHVCDSNEQIPATGPDSIAFPEIKFEFSSVKMNSNSILPEILEVGKVYSLAIQGKLTVHGQVKDFTAADSTEFIPVQVKLLDAQTGEIQLISKFDVVLKDFGVIVKPFKFGFVKINVADKAKVSLNMKLSPKK